ncbi:MAG: YegS/Rv2252/BmrU family lipid kinase [Chitinophagaceae bacterium]|nr:YegS/Rv2252/BmrU family lipid kinase [Chitinophagaceae bacterium]
MPTDSKNIAILCNQLAGSGKAVLLTERISDELVTRKISFTAHTDKWPDDFDGYTDVWIIGGDGTLNYFINKYKELKLPLVIFNGGTGNDFHWFLYGEIRLEKQIETVLAVVPRPIDIGKCNDRLFINGVGIGFEGEVARELTGKKKRAGKTSFMITVLKEIFSYRSKAYQITADGKSFERKRYLIIDINNGSRAGGGFHVAPLASASDGFFDLVVIDALRPIKRLRWLPVIEKGKHLKLPFVNYSTVKRILIESDDLIQFHLDGEYYSADKMEIEILSKKFLFKY